MNQIFTLTGKDIKLLLHDKGSIFVTFALPVALIAIVGAAFAKTFAPSLGITSYDYAFSKVMFWGLIGGVASSVATLAIEKSSGTIVRLQLAPLRKIDVLAGKALACIAVILLSSLLTWLFATLLFGIKTTAPGSLVLVCISNAIFFAGLMTFLGNFAKTERGAGALSWSVMQLLACFSGIMFPTTIMPEWMISITNFNPLTWAVKAMEIALWKHGHFADLWLPLSVTVGTGCAFFLLSVALLRWRE
jgi:ABC-2 type transport system permease protein